MAVYVVVHRLDPLTVQLAIQGASFEDVNTLRGVIISEVPTLALGTFTTRGSTIGVAETTLLKDRLPLVPLVMSDEQYAEYIDSTLTFSIDVSSDDPGTIRRVMSEDCVCLNGNVKLMPGIELVRVPYGSCVKVAAHTFKGVGRTHAMYMSTGVVTPIFQSENGTLNLTVNSIGGLSAELIFKLALNIMQQRGIWHDPGVVNA